MSFTIPNRANQNSQRIEKAFNEGLEFSKGHPVGYINAYGKQKQGDGSWKYVGKGKKASVEKVPPSKEARRDRTNMVRPAMDMKKLKIGDEGSFTNKEGEKLNVRVYKDGGVKIEGSNVRKDFKSKSEAEKYIATNKKNETSLGVKESVELMKLKGKTFDSGITGQKVSIKNIDIMNTTLSYTGVDAKDIKVPHKQALSRMLSAQKVTPAKGKGPWRDGMTDKEMLSTLEKKIKGSPNGKDALRDTEKKIYNQLKGSSDKKKSKSSGFKVVKVHDFITDGPVTNSRGTKIELVKKNADGSVSLKFTTKEGRESSTRYGLTAYLEFISGNKSTLSYKDALHMKKEIEVKDKVSLKQFTALFNKFSTEREGSIPISTALKKMIKTETGVNLPWDSQLKISTYQDRILVEKESGSFDNVKVSRDDEQKVRKFLSSFTSSSKSQSTKRNYSDDKGGSMNGVVENQRFYYF